MPDAVLTINAGSSSLKFSVYGIGEDDTPSLSAKGQVEGIGTSPRLAAEDAAGQILVERR
jgi:acetate kinase